MNLAKNRPIMSNNVVQATGPTYRYVPGTVLSNLVAPSRGVISGSTSPTNIGAQIFNGIKTWGGQPPTAIAQPYSPNSVVPSNTTTREYSTQPSIMSHMVNGLFS